MAKNRYFGFQPYVKYIQFCFGKVIKTWDDLTALIDPEVSKIQICISEPFLIYLNLEIECGAPKKIQAIYCHECLYGE